MRGDLAQQQVLEAVAAGAAAPQAEAVPLYQMQFEKRSADMVEFPFAAETAPAPTDAELQRWYDNHPERYSTPELRRIKAIVLSPQTLAKDIPITDDELRAAYNQRKAEYVTPEKRSAQVISVADEAKARALAEQWRGGADWTAMQAAAQQDGASAVALDDASQHGVSRRRPGQGGVRGADRCGVRSGEGRTRLVCAEGDQGDAGQREDLRRCEGSRCAAGCWPKRPPT